MGWIFGNRRMGPPPLHISVQRRDANPIGALGFAYMTPWAMPHAPLGAGVIVGSYRAEGVGLQANGAGVITQGYGGTFTGVLAQQPLSDPDYVLGASR